MVRRLSLIVPLVALVAVAGLVSQPAPAAAQVPDATQTPWVIVITVTQEAPTITPAPAVIVLVTPTPDPYPPSLEIPDLAALYAAVTSDRAPDDPPIPPAIDSKIADFMAFLEGEQQKYRGMTGRFAQMLPSHSTPPGEAGEYPDGWYNHPTDQQYNWDVFGVINFEKLPFQVTIDTYNGPEGAGYVACFTLLRQGDLWNRCINYGPEASRSHGWQVVAP